MFSEEMLKEVPDNLEVIFRQLETDVMEDVIRRIAQINKISRTADIELYTATQMRTYDTDLRKKIQQALKLSDEQMNHLYEDIVEEGYASDENLYSAAGVPFVPLARNKELKQLIDAVQEQAINDVDNITNTTGYVLDNNGTIVQSATQYFKNQLNRATVEIAAGAFNYDSTLKRITNELANSGLRTISYDSGRNERIDVATRRAVMTGLRQVTQKVADDNAKQLDTDYFEVSAHVTARPSHALWQGRVYTKKQLSDICGLGTGEGLCGWNCYHTYDPFIYGVSTRKYSDEELSQIYHDTLQTKEFDGKTYTPYQATQMQRSMERKMRVQDEKIALLKQGGASREDISAVRTRRIATYQRYKAFSDKMGLPEQMNRVFNSEIKQSSPVIPGATDIINEWKEVPSEDAKECTEIQDVLHLNGKDYKIDGHDVVYDYSKYEKHIGDVLANKYGRNVQMVPRVNVPDGIKTPDLMDESNNKYDIKTPLPTSVGDKVLKNLVKGKRMQADNFVFDLSKNKLSSEKVTQQIADIYRYPDTDFVRDIIIMKFDKIVRAYRRK